MLIQIHMLQNYAPSNLNRDDTGSPKNAFFGGVLRGASPASASSAVSVCPRPLKKPFREDGLLAMRTKRLPGLISDELQAMGVDDDTVEAIVPACPEIGSESGRGRGKAEEDEALRDPPAHLYRAERIAAAWPKSCCASTRSMERQKWKKAKIADITKALGASLPRSVDVAMFGRMTTSEAFEDVQAAVQVAHALSVNALAPGVRLLYRRGRHLGRDRAQV